MQLGVNASEFVCLPFFQAFFLLQRSLPVHVTNLCTTMWDNLCHMHFSPAKNSTYFANRPPKNLVQICMPIRATALNAQANLSYWLSHFWKKHIYLRLLLCCGLNMDIARLFDNLLNSPKYQQVTKHKYQHISKVGIVPFHFQLVITLVVLFLGNIFTGFPGNPKQSKKGVTKPIFFRFQFP